MLGWALCWTFFHQGVAKRSHWRASEATVLLAKCSSGRADAAALSKREVSRTRLWPRSDASADCAASSAAGYFSDRVIGLLPDAVNSDPSFLRGRLMTFGTRSAPSNRGTDWDS